MKRLQGENSHFFCQKKLEITFLGEKKGCIITILRIGIIRSIVNYKPMTILCYRNFTISLTSHLHTG